MGDEERRWLVCGGHASGPGVVERLLGPFRFAAPHRTAEALSLLARPSLRFDVPWEFVQLALQVVDPPGERLDLPVRTCDLGSVVPPGETVSGVADLVVQFLLPLGEVDEHLVVVAKSPAQPRRGSSVGGCSADESA